MSLSRTIFSIFLLSLVCSRALEAHDPGLSAVEVRLGERLLAHLTYSRADVDGELESIAARSLRIRTAEGVVPAARVSAWHDASEAVHFELEFAVSPGGALEIESTLLAELPRGHRQYAVVLDARETKRQEQLLDARRATFTVTALGPSPTVGLSQFLGIGMTHILSGSDHILFLLALLIGGTGLWNLAKVITAFTLAHSITLGLATLELVRLPSSVVEPLIAASIVYVAVENLSGRDRSHRWAVVFGFGLIHGLGFASALRDLGLSTDDGVSAVAPLIAFNVGVELGQIAILLAVYPLLSWLKRLPPLARWLPVTASCLVLALGLYWLIERTIGA